MKKVYLDNAATTKLDPEVFEAMKPYFVEKFGNPSSLHSWGVEAKKAVEKARAQVAKFLNCSPEEVYFTGSTTESDNLAILGTLEANQEKGRHIITSSIEHHGVLDVFKFLEKEKNFKVTFLAVDHEGRISVENFEKSISSKTIFASIMYVNNEVGTIQPISQLAAASSSKNVIFHTDAAAAKFLPLDVKKLKVDLLTLGPHKFGGPKGVGILFVKKGVRLRPVTLGGGQERGLRPGTENVPAIVGAGKAMELLAQKQNKARKKLERLRGQIIKEVLNNIPEVKFLGSKKYGSPTIATFLFKYIEGEGLVLRLSDHGVATSSGSACTSHLLEPSHVLLSMGIPAQEAHGSIRFSFSEYTTKEDINYVLQVLPKVVQELRAMSPIAPENL